MSSTATHAPTTAPTTCAQIDVQRRSCCGASGMPQQLSENLSVAYLTTEVLMPPKSRAAAYSDSSVMVAAVSATSASLSSRVAGMSSTCPAHHYAIVLFHKLRMLRNLLVRA
jgi:hypothetical protein